MVQMAIEGVGGEGKGKQESEGSYLKLILGLCPEDKMNK